MKVVISSTFKFINNVLVSIQYESLSCFSVSYAVTNLALELNCNELKRGTIWHLSKHLWKTNTVCKNYIPEIK